MLLAARFWLGTDWSEIYAPNNSSASLGMASTWLFMLQLVRVQWLTLTDGFACISLHHIREGNYFSLIKACSCLCCARAAASLGSWRNEIIVVYLCLRCCTYTWQMKAPLFGYCPRSLSRWRRWNWRPADLFSIFQELYCWVRIM